MITLKKTAPDSRVGFVVMLFSMLMFCVPRTHAAIVDGDFETDIVAGNPATSPLTSWSPTNSPDGSGIVLGINPAFYNSDFSSLVNAGGGTTGGSVSAIFTSGGPANQLASISQNVATTPGQFYDIRLWVANMSTTAGGAPDTGARENLFSVTWNGAPVDLTNPSVLGYSNFATPNPSNPNAVELAGAAGTYVLAATGGWTLVIIPNQAAADGGATTTNLTISAQNNNLATAVDAVEVVPEPSSIVLLAAGAALAGLRRRRQQRAA
jgi:hypothetical protein